MDQKLKGWLTEPFPLNFPSSSSCVLADRKLNIAFRFGVDQGGKLRACDDLKRSLTNLACSVLTPIKLVSWDHVAELCRLVSSAAFDWEFSKADHEADYKQLPLEGKHSQLAVIALKGPKTKRRYGFFIRTMVFGAVAAVLHYNVFSRTLAELANHFLGIPMLRFCDDFGALTPSCLTPLALQTFTSFCATLGIKLKKEKSAYGDRLVSLGLEGFSPCKANNMELRVSLPVEKGGKWSSAISLTLAEGKISAHALERIIGKLSFSQTCLFGKFARTQLRPLYKKLYRHHYVATLTPRETTTLIWRPSVLAELKPRIARGLGRCPDFILFTDAATRTPLIAGVLFRPSSRRVLQLTKGRVPSSWLRRFHRRNKIFGAEFLAPLAFLWTHGRLLRNSACTIYLDSNNAIASLLRGDSCDSFIAAMVAVFWKLIQKLGMVVLIGRVTSKLNVADLPTRYLPTPFEVEHISEFRQLLALLNECIAWLE